jgi:hypothetical protein
MKRYKFLNLEGKKIKSNIGNCTWKVGAWKHENNIDICSKGFHCSNTILDALSYVKGSILAEVEVKGKSIKQKDKSVHEDMCLKKVWYWRKEDSVALSIYAAELVIKNFEKKYPDDKRPREAIQAAKKWLKNPTEENASVSASSAAAYASSAAAYASTVSAAYVSAAYVSAAYAAASAYASSAAAASAAASAYVSAAYAAASAYAAVSAYASTASAAYVSAASAASSAASSKINKKINIWLIKHLKEMKKYE